MWPKTFAQRLESWYQLRQQAAATNLESAVIAINRWWLNSPWVAYHLHWDDYDRWPDPWQLLDDNIFCGLARGLGIMYTITLIDRPDLQNCWLAEHGSDNLVHLSHKKYILNWDRDTVVNITPGPANPRHRVSQQQLLQKIQ